MVWGYSGPMFGPGIRNVFKSRWHALFWSAGILLTAYCSVSSADDSQGSSGTQASAHLNPWAKDEAK